jgi:hypothetical protein
VFGEDAANDIFVEFDTEGVGDLLRDAHTAELGRPDDRKAHPDRPRGENRESGLHRIHRGS